MNKQNKQSNNLDFLLIDFVSGILAFFISYKIKFGDFGLIQSENWMSLLFVISFLNVLICLFSNPYSGIFKRAYYEEIIHAVLLTVYNLVATSVIFYAFKIGSVFSRQMILSMYVLYFFLSLAAKCFWKKLILSGKVKFYQASKTSTLIIAKKSNIDEILHNASASDIDEYDFNSFYFIDDDLAEGYCGKTVVKNSADIVNYCVTNGIEEVLVTVGPSEVPPMVFEKLIFNGIGVHFNIESMLGYNTEDYVIDHVGVYNTLSVGRYTFDFGQRLYLIVKRCFDILFGVVGVILLVPVTLIIKIISLLTGDTDKIFYSQTRVGQNGKQIKIYKFRTMVTNAEEILSELLKDEKQKEEWEANQKFINDPRITKLGKILRKTSVDELPQLINVLLGEMSLVGPRPLIVGELELHNGMKLYQQVKPGITGWWGCNGRSNIDYRERLEMEYYYVKNFSPYLDFLCVLRTVVSVLKREGAE